MFDDRDDRLARWWSSSARRWRWRLKDRDPLIDRLVIGRGVMREFADEPERQIIGVVGDVRNAGLERTGPACGIPRRR